jgi:hypothetical protein
MYKRFSLCASVFLVAAIGLSPHARAQQEAAREAEGEKQASHTRQTIHGVVAGITAEGEVFFNHQTSTSTKAEAAFMTVVGSPTHGEAAAEREHRAATTEKERSHAQVGERRHNVYILWLAPNTRICEMTREASGTEHAKKNVALDELEVGDRVEVAFVPEEQSASRANVHQTEHMRGKHGRHRTHVGIASAITIMRPSEHGQSGEVRGVKDREGAK